jgi:hypothetical protein
MEAKVMVKFFKIFHVVGMSSMTVLATKNAHGRSKVYMRAIYSMGNYI